MNLIGSFGRKNWRTTVLPFVVTICLTSALSACHSSSLNESLRHNLDTLSTDQLASGVSYSVLRLPEKPLVIHVITVAEAQSPAAIKMGIAQNGKTSKLGYLSPVLEIAEKDQTDNHQVIGAINGGLFSTSDGKPEGLVIKNGEVVNLPDSPRPKYFLYTTNNGNVKINHFLFQSHLTTTSGNTIDIETINRFGHKFSSAFLNHYYPVPQGGISADIFVHFHPINNFAVNTPFQIVIDSIGTGSFKKQVEAQEGVILASKSMQKLIENNLSVGDTVTMSINFVDNENSIKEAIEGWPTIELHDRNVIKSGTSGFKYNWLFSNLPMSRTAIGLSGDDKFLYIVTVDGPSDWNLKTVFQEFIRWIGFSNEKESLGLSLSDLSDLMKYLGARESINLDGGSSTTMVIRQNVVSNPDKEESDRPVANALLLVQPKKQ